MRQSRWKQWVDYVYLAAISLISYWPVSFFVFSLKNDSAAQYLPFRYSLSEVIQQGHFPFWSPYLYTGFPVHADMQGMTWNPIVLALSFIKRYDMSWLQLEVTIYLLLAAWGMYALLKSFRLHRLIGLAGAVCYMSCGYINGSASVIPWIASASFIPYVFLYLRRFLEKPAARTAILFGLFNALLFLCGYPSLFIYTAYISGAVILLYLFDKEKRRPLIRWRFAGFMGLSILLFLCLCAPAIISYWEFLPYYSRGAGVSLERAQENPFPLFSSLSFILPDAVLKDHPWLYTDLNMRNTYVGLLTFILFIFSCFARKDRTWYFIFGITLFSYLFSLGDLTPLRKITYYTLPLFDTFRHPGNFRLYSSLGVLLLAARFAQQLTESNNLKWIRAGRRTGVILAAVSILIALALLLDPAVRSNMQYLLSNLRLRPKAWLDLVSFDTFLWSQLLLQLAFIAAYTYWLIKGKLNRSRAVRLTVFNAVVFCWIALPFTFISQVTTRSFDGFVHGFPKGYPIPDPDKPVRTNDYSDSLDFPVYGYTNFYIKDITFQDQQVTPTLNTDYETFSRNPVIRRLLHRCPWAYLADSVIRELPEAGASYDSSKRYAYWPEVKAGNDRGGTAGAGSILTLAFGPNRFVLDIRSSSPALLNIFQQFHHSWKASVNGQPITVHKTNVAFMGIEVPAGRNRVVFEYRPQWVILGGYVSLACLALLVAFGIWQLVVSKREIQETAGV